MRALPRCLLLVALVAASGCRVPVNTLRGMIEYGERLRLPPEAEVDVDLIEVVPGMAPAVVVRRTFPFPGELPIEFEVERRQAERVEGATYAVAARLRLGERVVFASAEPVVVDLETARRVRLVVVRQR